jgi:starch-binding outer membrane protein SusE/F
MMKKLLFSAGVFMMGTVAMFAQFPNIGIVGGSTSVGWVETNALPMTTTDGETYHYEGLVVTVPGTDPGVKFVKDNAWTTSWGGSGFPSGTATTSNGPNIPATNGTWDVTLNIVSGTYSFVPAGVEYDEVNLINGAASMALMTDNGVNYHLDNVTFDMTSNVAFSIDDTETGWGSNAFPSGTAVAGQMIPVPANSYNIEFSLDTKAYNFDFVTVSLVGTGVFPDDPLWTTDLDLTTTNGVDYTINSFNFPGGEAKFRLNHQWTTAWGSADFPSGTATTGESPNLNITAGTYSVNFNRISGAFSFGAPTAGTEGFNKSSITVFPNPAQNAWNFNAGSNTISSMQIVDVAGKVVYSAAVNAAQATVNASGFASGMYFARLTSGNATETIRLVKN